MSRSSLAATLLALALGACAHAKQDPDQLEPEVERQVVRTADGALVVLVHYAPTAAARAAPPVVLVHGIAANARHMDLDPQHSLARWLAAQGFDAWVLSMRGTGKQFVPDGTSLEAQEGTTIDTYAEQDLPAAFDYVRQHTHAPRVDVVAHSMGGLVTYAYLARGGTAINAAVTLGSPVRLRMGDKIEGFILKYGHGLGGAITVLPNEKLGKVNAKGIGTIDEGPLNLVAGNPPANTSYASFAKLLRVGSADTTGGVVRQFQRCIADDRFESADGSQDYLAQLGQVKVPTLVVAGKTDRIAHADGVKAAYEALGGEKRFFIAGEEAGFASDYGHADMIIGDDAPKELWPLIADWFDKHP
jgi:pimeloyl-ACP methyl ester carboxylesterase